LNTRAPRGAQPSFSDLDKPLYTISVAAEILETHPRTLMLYEDAALIEPTAPAPTVAATRSATSARCRSSST